MCKIPLYGVLLFICIIAGCDTYEKSNLKSKNIIPPEHPVSVPSSAVWAGYIDGGLWYDCNFNEKYYKCSIYTDSGILYSIGKYLIFMKGRPKSCKKIFTSEELFFDSTDEGVIYLKNNFNLAADGFVVFPYANKKQRYDCGAPVGDETEYKHSVNEKI